MMEVDRDRGPAVGPDVFGRGSEFAPAIVLQRGLSPARAPQCQPESDQSGQVLFAGRGGAAGKDHVGAVLILGPKRPVDRGIGRQRQHFDRAAERPLAGRRHIGSRHEDGVIRPGHREDLIDPANVIGKPVDQPDPSVGPDGVHQPFVDVIPPNDQHQAGLGHLDALEEPGPEVAPAEPAEQARPTAEIEGGDIATQPLESPSSLRGMGILAVVERRNQEDGRRAHAISSTGRNWRS